MMTLKPSRVLLIFLGAAVLGLALFGILDETTADGDRLLVWAE